MSDKTIYPGRGQTWTHRSTKKPTEIFGRRMRTIVHLSAAAHGYVETPLNEFLSEYEFKDCNHDAGCCLTHGSHAVPHTGCILR